jgi:hypothetical protein
VDDAVLVRLEILERKLDLLLEAQAAPEGEWLDAKAFCRLVGLKDTKALSYQMSKGVISGDSLRNIGTVRRPCYRFHRRRAVDQFLNRSQLTG